jgi:hypothetical protein
VHDPELDSVWETTHTADICLWTCYDFDKLACYL